MTGPCWPYLGALTDGYGQATYQGKKVSVHRAVYEVLVGPIPPGMQLDHLCRNRACYNPDHLEVVSQQENIRRGEKPNRTHCPKGHSLEDARMVRSGPGGRYVTRSCRTCHNLRELERKRGR